MPSASWEEATRRQYNDDTNLAARQALFDYLVEATPLAAPLNDLSSLADDRVLDVGCGNGQFLNGAAVGGAMATGCDLSLGMVRSARAASDAPVFQADAHRLPVASGAIDTVLALWMLYHLDDKPAAIAEMARVLRPGGQLVAATNSSRDGDIGELMCAALGDVLGTATDGWHPPLSFTSENGAPFIADVFGDDAVEAHPFGTTFAVDDASVLVGYAGSMLEPMHQHRTTRRRLHCNERCLTPALQIWSIAPARRGASQPLASGLVVPGPRVRRSLP
ncbi:MAG: class I SAM-dependent methyltransferase [Acidimicrobiales bacterium]